MNKKSKKKKKRDKKWKTYEQVAGQLLYDIREYLDLEKIEGKQHIKGKRSGAEWEVEAIAYKNNNTHFIIVECKRWRTKKPSQETLGGLAYRIIDADASGGIIVTPLGIQSGAMKVAEAEKIKVIKLDINATEDSYIAEIADQIFMKTADNIKVTELVIVKIVTEK